MIQHLSSALLSTPSVPSLPLSASLQLQLVGSYHSALPLLVVESRLPRELRLPISELAAYAIPQPVDAGLTVVAYRDFSGPQVPAAVDLLLPSQIALDVCAKA